MCSPDERSDAQHTIYPSARRKSNGWLLVAQWIRDSFSTIYFYAASIFLVTEWYQLPEALDVLFDIRRAIEYDRRRLMLQFLIIVF